MSAVERRQTHFISLKNSECLVYYSQEEKTNLLTPQKLSIVAEAEDTE